MRQAVERLSRRRRPGRRLGVHVSLKILAQRIDVRENLPADFLAGNPDPEFPLDAGEHQQDIQRINVRITAEKWRLGFNRNIGPELEISSHDEPNTVQYCGWRSGIGHRALFPMIL